MFFSPAFSTASRRVAERLGFAMVDTCAAEFATSPGAIDPSTGIDRALCLAIDPDLVVTVNAMTAGYVVNDETVAVLVDQADLDRLGDDHLLAPLRGAGVVQTVDHPALDDVFVNDGGHVLDAQVEVADVFGEDHQGDALAHQTDGTGLQHLDFLFQAAFFDAVLQFPLHLEDTGLHRALINGNQHMGAKKAHCSLRLASRTSLIRSGVRLP